MNNYKYNPVYSYTMMTNKQIPPILRQTVLKKYNRSCCRCDYNENAGSLHIHHIDHNYHNNNLDNLIVLCANCHHSLHHNKWKLIEIGIQEPRLNINSIKRSYNWCTKKKEIEYLNEIESQNQTIKSLKQSIEQLEDKYSLNLMIKNRLIDIMIEYTGLYSFKGREELILIETVYNAYLASLSSDVDGWSSYNANDDMMSLIKKSAEYISIKTKHYATPSTTEMAEVAESKPII